MSDEVKTEVIKDLIQNVFNLHFDGHYIYQQYREIPWVNEFIKVVDNYLQEKFLDKLEWYFSHKNIENKFNGDYVIFYANHYLGIKRPLSQDLKSTDTTENEDDNKFVFYDNFNHYDTGDFWDWKYTPNPLMSFGQFKRYLFYIMDYHQVTWTLDYIMHLPEVMLDSFNAYDIKVVVTPLKIYLYMPIRLNNLLRKEVTSFISMTKTDNDIMNMPFGDCFEFRQGTHIEGIRTKSGNFMLGDEIETTEDPKEGFPNKKNP